MPIRGILGWLLVLSGWLAAGAPAAERPHIVYILADDLGYGDVRALAPQTSRIPTPHLDRLVSEGMRFTDAHSGSSVCTPTRYGVMTGRYAWRTRLQHGVVTGFAPSLIAADRPTVAQFLQTAGYATAAVGKWHLDVLYLDPDTGERYRRSDHRLPPLGAVIPDGPTARGFDTFHGFHHSREMRAVIDQDRVTEYADPETMLPRIAERSVQVIRDHAGDSQPLFLYVALSSLHTPIVPTPEWQGRSGLSEYGDFVMQTDDAVGQILAALEECELAKETLVIFTSDNGCSKAAGIEQLAEQGHAVSGPYRGSKADLWEGGHRVPFLVRWPGKVDAGTDCHQTICLTDLFATVVELVGREPPVGSCEDSVSFLPALRGETIPRQRSGIVHHSISGHFAYRHEDWKLLLARGSGGWTQPTERALRDRPPAGQLYDLSRDPGERHNQFETRPEMVQRLLGFLREDVRKGHSVGVGESANDQATIRLWKSGAPERGPPKQ